MSKTRHYNSTYLKQFDCYKKCINCGTDKNIKMHHVVPISLGGNDILSNIVPLCAECHSLIHLGVRLGTNIITNWGQGGRPRAHADGYLSIKECSEKYNKCKRTIETAIAHNRLQGYLINNVLYTTNHDYEEYSQKKWDKSWRITSDNPVIIKGGK